MAQWVKALANRPYVGPEFHPWIPYGGRRELTLSCKLSLDVTLNHGRWYAHVYKQTHERNEKKKDEKFQVITGKEKVRTENKACVCLDIYI